MLNKNIVPCLWFDNQAEQAAQFYTAVFPSGHITAVSRYSETSDNPSGKPRGSVMTVEFDIVGQRFTALNGGPYFTINPSISFFVLFNEAGQAESLLSEQVGVVFAALADGGQVLMPLSKYPWSDCYGWVRDKYGVSWQLMISGEFSKIMPCFMFSDDVHGKAAAAMQFYTSAFSNSTITSSVHYEANEGPVDTIKHGRFVIAGQHMVAMDSHFKHGFSFNEGISMQAMCADQQELDALWEKLSAGGSKSRCGWLKDQFGVSWQVVPQQIAQWMTTSDPAAKDRALQAMLTMDKLDIATLERALQG
jgi:predicted 3-demethylubiquinone-9 3-methyltransferase (glyoxalase superfamily)